MKTEKKLLKTHFSITSDPALFRLLRSRGVNISKEFKRHFSALTNETLKIFDKISICALCHDNGNIEEMYSIHSCEYPDEDSFWDGDTCYYFVCKDCLKNLNDNIILENYDKNLFLSLRKVILDVLSEMETDPIQKFFDVGLIGVYDSSLLSDTSECSDAPYSDIRSLIIEIMNNPLKHWKIENGKISLPSKESNPSQYKEEMKGK